MSDVDPDRPPAADPCSDPSRCVPTIEACPLLGVGPSTLRDWYGRFGVPRSCALNGRRHFLLSEVVALRDALRGGRSIDAAVRVTKQEVGPDAQGCCLVEPTGVHVVVPPAAAV
jgi:hypothetical protein